MLPVMDLLGLSAAYASGRVRQGEKHSSRAASQPIVVPGRKSGHQEQDACEDSKQAFGPRTIREDVVDAQEINRLGSAHRLRFGQAQTIQQYNGKPDTPRETGLMV